MAGLTDEKEEKRNLSMQQKNKKSRQTMLYVCSVCKSKKPIWDDLIVRMQLNSNSSCSVDLNKKN